MTLRWRGEQAKEALRLEMAKRLLAAAVLLQSELKRELSDPYPPASVPGQFPRLRTGWLRSHVLIAPASVAEIARTLEVRLGYARNARYGVYLELKLKRLGLLAASRKYKARLRQVLGKAGTVELRGT